MLSPLSTVPKRELKVESVHLKTFRTSLVAVIKTPPTTRDSLIAQSIKNLPTMQESQIGFLEDPVEKEMATHSCILA